MHIPKEVVMTKYFAALLTFFIAWPSIAADLNGYTAQYECRAGGPNCNVDVAALGNRSCDQTIAASTPWSSINWSNSTICLENGDHTSKGTLTIPSSANGTSGNYKVLRYTRSGDTNDDPWNQSTGNRVKLRGVSINGADYWIIHRLTIDGDGASNFGIHYVKNSGVTNIIVNRLLVEDFSMTIVATENNGPNITIQNSVIRNAHVTPTAEYNCIELSSASGVRIVNNEIYDCNKAISSGDGNPSIPDAKIENNDLYTSPAVYTDCNGNYTPWNPNSVCAAMEAIISLKTGGLSNQPVEIIHNRLWGARTGDGVAMSEGNTGEAFSISLTSNPNDPSGYGAHYVLVKNNIIWDAQAGISNWWGTPHHVSIIGNIIYKIRAFDPRFSTFPIRLRRMDRVEVYLNTIIDSPETWIDVHNTDVTNSDIRCNIAITSGGNYGGASSTTEIANNAFYGVPMFTTDMAETNIAMSNVSDAANVEYCFNRKLRTGAEKFCIPNARSTTTSPHYQACNNTLGTRTGIGIDDLRLF